MSRNGLISVALLAAAHCAISQPTDEMFHPEPDPRLGGFVDVALRIQSQDCRRWDQCRITARGSHGGTPVALTVSLQRDARKNLVVQYQSVGPESDQFLRSLAELYKLDAHDSHFSPLVVAYMVPLTLSNTGLKGKFFFSPDGPDYAELYTNIDLTRGTLEIHEKDESYRSNVIKAFSR